MKLLNRKTFAYPGHKNDTLIWAFKDKSQIKAIGRAWFLPRGI